MREGATVPPRQFISNEGKQVNFFSMQPIQHSLYPPNSSVRSEETSRSALPQPGDNILSSVGHNSLMQSATSNSAFNSLNIKRLVQQSNNYWQAERTFFSSEKRHPGEEHEELEKLERSIQNIANNNNDGASKSSQYSSEDRVATLSPLPQPTQITNNPFTGRHQPADGSASTAATGTTATSFFSQSKKLQEISFSFSFVKKGATELGKFQLCSNNSASLQIVDLSYNKFRDVPDELLCLKQLRVLKMDTNLIKVLKPELFTHLKLEYFSIANNLLFEVPELIVLWKDTLKYLDISLNRIEDLSVLSELRFLQSLHIQNNDFRSLPTSLHILMNSQFKELTFDWFQYTQPPLDLRQSGQIGMKVIQRLKLFLQSQYENNNPIASFMDTVLQLSASPANFDILRIDKKNHNRSLAHLAAAREEIGCLISLLENKYALINALDSEKHTPLSLSILQEKFFSAKTLISNGADVNLGGALFGNCLNLATIKYQYYLVLDLLKRGANPNAQDSEGNTPLHYIMAIFHRDKEYSSKICDLLLQFRADPNILNKDQWAPIHLLSRRGTAEGFQFISDYNSYLAENNYQNKRLEGIALNLQMRSASQQPPTITSAPFQPFFINLRGGKQRQTPLHIACGNSCYNLANLLLKSGADIFARDSANKMPLHLCMRDNFLCKLLKQKETEIFDKFFSAQREIPSYCQERTQCSSSTPLKSILTNQSFIQMTPNRSNITQPFMNDERTPKKNEQLNRGNSINEPQNKNKSSASCANNNAQIKFDLLKSSQLNTQGTSPAQRPCFAQQELKGSDSVMSLDDWEDNNTKNKQINQLKMNSQKKDSIANMKTSGMITDRQDEGGGDEDAYESSIASRVAQISAMPGMSVKGNSKNYSYLAEEKEQKMQPCQGQLCRSSMILSKQHFKHGEDEKESLNFDDEQDFDPSNFQDLDEKEEEFLNSEIDEAKNMLELFNTKKKIINQSLAYAPNNIQQLNYIQAINRENLKKSQITKQSAQQHLRSKSAIPSVSKISQKSTSKGQSTATTKEKPRGLIKNDGAEVPFQLITPQHISFFQYLLEKTKNMYEYYSVSLHNYKKGILSEFNTLYEKYRYFIILVKLQIEFQNMILHLVEEKKQLSALLGGDVPFLQLGGIDQRSTNSMVMNILLEILRNLKCENHSLLLLQIDFPSPTIQTFLSSAQTPNSNMSYWMRQYEESFPEILPIHTLEDEDKFQLVEGSCHQRINETQHNDKEQLERVRLNERENSLIKENIICQLGNYHFNETLEYLEAEIKHSNTSTLNAFEACQSFFKIKESLIAEASTVIYHPISQNTAFARSKPTSDYDSNETIQSSSLVKQIFLKSGTMRPNTVREPKEALDLKQNNRIVDNQRINANQQCSINSNTLKGNQTPYFHKQIPIHSQQQLILTEKAMNNQKDGFSTGILSKHLTHRDTQILPQNKPLQAQKETQLSGNTISRQ